MDAMQIGSRIVELCREGKNLEAINTLYADTIESVEAAAPPTGGDKVTKGIEGVRGKAEWWANNHEVHSADVRGPFPNGDQFCLIFNFDVTNKPMNQRMKMEEVGLYTCQNGKVVKEEFFYSMG